MWKSLKTLFQSLLGLPGINWAAQIWVGDCKVRCPGSGLGFPIPSFPTHPSQGTMCLLIFWVAEQGGTLKKQGSMPCVNASGSTFPFVCLYIQIRYVAINQCAPFVRSCWRFLQAAGINQRFYHSFIRNHRELLIRQWNVPDSFWLLCLQLLKPRWAEFRLPGALQHLFPHRRLEDEDILSRSWSGSALGAIFLLIHQIRSRL